MSIVSQTISTVELDIEGEIKKAWNWVEGTAIKDAEILWGDGKAVIISILPNEYVILKGFVQQAILDVVDGDYAALETAVLNLASASANTFVQGLGKLLPVFIALIKANLP